ncbi:flagellar motor protein MotB [Algicola sagamiensis]|uniref:flagellar motor protein MotB n=1 Tax=Algicola sagamiensis TaxID=163869 RepID=UPI000363AD26|nr:flagellar motor protein MotB [Algicola sagamiensis]
MRKPLSRYVEEESENHLERWLISYADYMTLMFALFVVLYAYAMVNEEQYKSLRETIETVFTQPTEEGTGVKGEGLLLANKDEREQNLYGDSLLPEKGPELVEEATALSNITKKALGNPLAAVEKDLQTALTEHIDKGDLKVTRDEDWVTIEMSSGLLFSSGSAAPTPFAYALMSDVGKIVNRSENFVRVRGYTDDLPIRNEVYESNWELSVARATAVLRMLERQQVKPYRMAIEGYGPYSPFVPNVDESSRTQNRKVVVAISKFLATQPQFLVKKEAKPVEVPVKIELPSIPEDSKEVQIIQLEGGGIRVTTRRNNPDSAQENIENKEEDNP